MTDERNRALREALNAIGTLPTGKSEDVMEGQEQAYRAIEALIDQPEPVTQGVTDYLIPCPFCGDAASVREDGEHSTAFVLEHFSKGCPVDDLWDWYPDKEQAIAAWNRRTLTTAPVSTAEAARGIATVEGGEIVIRVPFTVLTHEPEPRGFSVVSPEQFAPHVAREVSGEDTGERLWIEPLIEAAMVRAAEADAPGIEWADALAAEEPNNGKV